MRVLRVSAGFDPRHGGPAQSTLLSTLAAAQAGVDIEVATIDEGAASAPAIARLRNAGVSVHAFPLQKFAGAYRFTVSRALMQWTWANAPRFDAIHVHGAWTASSFVGLFAGRARQIPVVMSAHESLTQHDVVKSGVVVGSIKRLIRSLYFASLSAVIYASDIERRDSAPVGRAQHVVIPHPVESESSVPVKEASSRHVKIGFLGRFDPKKNLDLLLRSLPVDGELIVAGDGPPEITTALRKLADSIGVAERVRWLGFVQDETKSRFLRQIDLLAMPSRYEGFGMVAAEALAAGVPVVVSRNSGIASLIERHECGYVVDANEESLRAVLATRAGLAAKADRAQSAVASELAPQRHGSELVDVYGAVASTRAR